MSTTQNTYRVICIDPNSWHKDGTPSCVGEGSEHRHLHAALVEVSARVLLEGEGSSCRWQVEGATPEECLDEIVEADEVCDFLVDVLGEDAGTAERLVS